MHTGRDNGSDDKDSADVEGDRDRSEPCRSRVGPDSGWRRLSTMGTTFGARRPGLVAVGRNKECPLLGDSGCWNESTVVVLCARRTNPTTTPQKMLAAAADGDATLICIYSIF